MVLGKQVGVVYWRVWKRNYTQPQQPEGCVSPWHTAEQQPRATWRRVPFDMEENMSDKRFHRALSIATFLVNLAMLVVMVLALLPR